MGLYRSLAEDDQLATRLRYSVFNFHADAFNQAGIRCGDGDELFRAAAWVISCSTDPTRAAPATCASRT